MDTEPIPITEREKRFWEKAGLFHLLAPGPVRNTRKLLAVVCPHCGKHLFGLYNYKYHLMDHTDEILYGCEHCDFKCKRRDQLRFHMKVHTSDISKEPFVVTTLTASDTKTLESKNILSYLMPGGPFRRIEDNKLVFVCPECGRKQYGAKQLIRHRKNAHSEENKHFICDFCDFTARHKSALERHSVMHSDERSFVCPTCGKGFNDRMYLIRHIRVHETTKASKKCLDCDEEFLDEYLFSRHINEYHPGYKAHECQYCGKRFMYPGVKNDHESIHTETKGYTCEYCDKQFNKVNSYRQHLKSHKKKDDRTCYICREEFQDTFLFQKHCQRHTEYFNTKTNKYECALCDKKILKGVYTQLVKHMQICHSERNFECKICTHKSYHEKALAEHMKVHNRKKEHQCFFCKEIFPDFASFKLHRLEHSDVYNKETKEYTCPNCGVKNIAYTRIIDHIAKQHTDEKPFSCEYCPRIFSSDMQKRSHKFYFHKIAKRLRKNIFDCKVCNARFTDEKVAMEHSEVHRKKKSKESEILLKTDCQEFQNTVKEECEEALSGDFMETSPLPLAARVYQDCVNNKDSCIIIWTKSLEADLLTLVSLHAPRCYVCIAGSQNKNTKKTKAQNSDTVRYNQVEVKLKTDNNVIEHVTIVSSAEGNMLLRSKNCSSVLQLEDYLKRRSKLQKVIHFIRSSYRDLFDRMSHNLKSRTVVCNVIEDN